MTIENQKALARSRAEAKYLFYKHLGVFVVINLMLFVINITTSPNYIWAVWPLFGWGVAIALHALQVFAFGGRNAVLDRMTEMEMQKDD